MKRFKNESDFTRWYVDSLRSVNCVCKGFVASRMQVAGLPDRYVCGQGIPGVWLESKIDDGRLSELQRLTLLEFNDHGVPALCLRCVEGDLQFEIPTRDGKYLAVHRVPLCAGVHLRAEIRAAVRNAFTHGLIRDNRWM